MPPDFLFVSYQGGRFRAQITDSAPPRLRHSRSGPRAGPEETTQREPEPGAERGPPGPLRSLRDLPRTKGASAVCHRRTASLGPLSGDYSQRQDRELQERPTGPVDGLCPCLSGLGAPGLPSHTAALAREAHFLARWPSGALLVRLRLPGAVPNPICGSRLIPSPLLLSTRNSQMPGSSNPGHLPFPGAFSWSCRRRLNVRERIKEPGQRASLISLPRTLDPPECPALSRPMRCVSVRTGKSALPEPRRHSRPPKKPLPRKVKVPSRPLDKCPTVRHT